MDVIKQPDGGCTIEFADAIHVYMGCMETLVGQKTGFWLALCLLMLYTVPYGTELAT